MMKNAKRILSFLVALTLVLSYVPGFVLTARTAGSDLTLDTKIPGLSASYTDASAKNPGTVIATASQDASNGAVTIHYSVEGFKQVSGSKAAWLAETTTMTLTNSLDSEAVLTFNYAVELAHSSSKVSIAGTEYTGTGVFEKTLQAGESVTIALVVKNVPNTSNEASVKLTNVSFGANPDVETTFKVAENGTYSVSYGDTTVAITEETKITNKATTNYTLTATPAEGYSFAGWYDYTKNAYIAAGAVSENVRFVDPENPAKVAPLFVKTADAIYGVGDARFADFAAATTYAANAVDKVVVLLKDDTLTAGYYSVPAGVTLLIPFDNEHTLYRETPGCTSSKNNNVAWVTPYAFRTLTLAANAVLEVDGEISVGSKHSAGGQQTAGSPTGPYGHIAMQENSNITVKDGGFLYAWGYITGEGTVRAESGSHVYENLQITDFRGGGASVTMVPQNAEDPLLAEKKVFPFSQYYVQNIEVALILHSGAVESVCATMYALEDVYSTSIEFIGTMDSMFFIGENSYVVKDYDPATDRLNISAYGTGSIAVNSLSVSMAGTTIASSMFNLPITSNVTINIMGGDAIINQDVALLPGSQLNIASGATMTLGYGYNLFVYDSDDWSKGYANIAVGVEGEKTIYEQVWQENCYFVHSNVRLRPVSFSPSGKATRTEADLVDAKIDINGTLYVEGYMYTTNGGANITSSEGTGIIWYDNDAGTQDHTNQVTQSGTDVTFVNIPITAAKLLNADGSYTATTGTMGGNGYGWDAVAGKWTNCATVYFDGNGASGEVDKIETSYEDIYWAELFGEAVIIELPGNGFEASGKTFLGWNTKADGTGDSYAPGDEFVVTGNVILYAQWEAVTYEVIFKDDNGNVLTDLTVVAEYGETITLPALPAREGYEACWVVNGVYYAAGETIEVTGAMEFIAVYEAIRYDLFFDGNGGYYNGDPECTVIGSDDAYEYGYVIQNMGTPYREGYTFVEWNTKPDGTGTKLVFGETKLTSDVTYYAIWEANVYYVTWQSGFGGGYTTQVVYGAEITIPTDAEFVEMITKPGYTLTGWEGYTEGMTMPAMNLTFTAIYTANQYTLTIYWSEITESGEVIWTAETYTVPYGADLSQWIVGEAEDIIADGDEYQGVWTFQSWLDGELNETTVPATMPANDLTLRQNYVFTGWAHNAKGTTYLVEGEVAYMNVVAHIYGNAYLFNEEGCLVAGAGLYRYVTAEGVVEYYYFDEGSYIAVKNTSMWIENVNGLLPVWEYKFDANGVIEHHEDTSLNGIQKIEGVKYYFIDGVKAYMGLIQVDGDYYYVRSNGQLVVNCTYWISKTNDLMKEKAYQFDAEGKMIIGDHPAVKNGIYAEDGSLFYYENGERVYAGLIEIDGHYYYVKTNCEVVHGGNYWITKTNGIMKQGKYYFNEQGQLGDEPDELKKNGLFEEDGKLYYYEAGIRTYAGLIEIDGHYYYIKSGCYAVTDGTYWVTKTNGIMKAGNYTFDAQGRMVIKEEEPGFTGLKTEGDKIFYYENGIRTYAGLIKIDGYYYYIKSNCEAVKGGEFWITKTNGIVKEGRYTFDEQGRMVTE